MEYEHSNVMGNKTKILTSIIIYVAEIFMPPKKELEKYSKRFPHLLANEEAIVLSTVDNYQGRRD